jgi:hypothetical protein
MGFRGVDRKGIVMEGVSRAIHQRSFFQVAPLDNSSPGVELRHPELPEPGELNPNVLL